MHQNQPELLFSGGDLSVASAALMHIGADSRPPVGPPCPLFPSSTPSRLHSHTYTHTLVHCPGLNRSVTVIARVSRLVLSIFH